MESNRLISRNIRLLIDEWRVFLIVGFIPTATGMSPEYLRIYIKPYDGRLDKELRSHAISITKHLQKGESLSSLAEDQTKESIVGQIIHYIKNNWEEILACIPLEKEVRLNTDPYKKIK